MGRVVDIIVQILYASNQWDHEHLPTALELPAVYSAEDAERELLAWGLHCKVFLCGEHDVIFAQPRVRHHEGHIHVYIHQQDDQDDGVFVHQTARRLTDIEHMKYLYTLGFSKAVLLQREIWNDYTEGLHFTDVKPEAPADSRRVKNRTPWPQFLPSQTDQSPLFDPDIIRSTDASTCLLELNFDAISGLFLAQKSILWQDYHLFDLPEFIRHALDACGHIEKIDRYVIFTDGSSQSKNRHKPPLWVAEHDVSDSWAFAVFGEQYPPDQHSASKLQFLGWHCQNILCDPEAAHYLGTDRIGSDSSETEAMIWAGLWRLSQNNRIPTTFVSDSRLIGDQAAGRIGSNIQDEPFLHLRAIFQALEAGLTPQGLSVEHVNSHSGDPFNELVDWLAKREPHQSQLLPRQAVDMKSLRPLLRHLWMVLDTSEDIPASTATGLDLSAMQLPNPIAPFAPSPMQTKTTSLHLSLATGNVRTFYRGEHGHPGKLHYIREQFLCHDLHFIGLQETRTAQGSSCQSNIYRLSSGDDRGQLGVELWANLAQPINTNKGPAYFLKRQHFVVVSTSPRHLLVHLVNDILDIWLLVAHAPHSGHDPETRTRWWSDLSGLLTSTVGDGHVLVMIDANARTGPADHRHILDKDDVAGTTTTDFRDFLSQHNLCAPATALFHQGDFATWSSPTDDHQLRIDYVLIPCDWMPSCTFSGSLDNLDFGHLGDHRAMAIELQWKDISSIPSKRRTSQSYDRTKLMQIDLAHKLGDYRPLPWNADIETQVNHLNDYIQQALHETCPPTKQGPKKSFISDETWALRTDKLRLQRRDKTCKQSIRRELLARIFHAWKGDIDDGCLHQSHQYQITLQVDGVRIRAELHATARRLRRALTQARRQEVQRSLQSLPDDCSAAAILNTIKPLIGTTNPKLKRSSPLPSVLKDDGTHCCTPQELSDRWISFFGAMEGGERQPHQVLRDDWCKNLHTFCQEELHLQPHDLPSLTCV